MDHQISFSLISLGFRRRGSKGKGTEYIKVFSLFFFFNSKRVTISGTTTINYRYMKLNASSTCSENHSLSSSSTKQTVNRLTTRWSTLDDSLLKLKIFFLSAHACKPPLGGFKAGVFITSNSVKLNKSRLNRVLLVQTTTIKKG